MTATYTNTLATDKDRVRFHLGDTDTTDPILQDEEITAILALEANYWLAAATCGDAILAKWAGESGGLSEKQVGRLRVRFRGEGGGSYRAHVEGLRKRGRHVQAPRPKVFRSL